MMPPLCFHDRSGFTAGLPCFTDSSGVPMRLSRFLLPILKENPKEAEIVSHRLMLRAGMIRQEPAGLPSWPPHGVAGLKRNHQHDLDEAAARRSSNKMFVVYLWTFARMGLKAIPMRAETGPIGGDLSHEFIVLAETGESAVYCDSDVLNLPVPGEEIDYDGDLIPVIKQWTSVYAATEDVHDAARFDREVPAEKKLHTSGIEVGQIFYFGTKYSDTMKATVAGPAGAEVAVHGGSYGVGVSRLVGAIIEACHDDAGIKWPEAVAPFKAAILNLKQGSDDTDAACERLYRELTAKGVDVLYDDTDQRAGAKFAAADLIGIPWQILVGPKGLAEGKLEIKRRSDGTRENLSPAEVVARLTS